MKERLFKHWYFKLLACVLAVLIWFVVMGYEDPVGDRTIGGIPISLENVDMITKAGKSYSVGGSLYATVKVRGVESVIRSLTASDFTARADIAKLYDVTGQVPVEISMSGRYQGTVEMTPQTSSIKVNLESILTKRINIQIEQQGSVAEGYHLGSLSTNPKSVTVKAPESVMEKIASVRVSANLDGITENGEQTVALKYYSEGGALLDLSAARDTSFSIDETKVLIEVLTVKTVPVVVSVGDQDQVASGYRYTGVQQSQPTVTLSGLKSNLARVSAINIPETDLSVAGARGDQTRELALDQYLPEGLTLAEGQAQTLTVTMQVEKLSVKTYELPKVELIGTDPALQYVLQNTPLKAQLRALEADFAQFDLSKVKASVDVTDMAPGTYTLPVNLTVESVFEPVGTVNLLLEIHDPAAEATEESTEELPEVSTEARH